MKGEPSKKEKEINLKKKMIENVKNSSVYKDVLEKFSDAELIEVKINEKNNKDD